MAKATCAVDRCDRPARTRGWCGMHYQRVLATGSPGPAGPARKGVRPRPVQERFWAKVDKNGPGGCWLWTGGIMAIGYGYPFWVDAERRETPHRLSFEWHKGAIPAGSDIDHMCHVRNCVNPDHLQAVSRTLNNENRVAANRNSKTGVRGVCWDAARGRYMVKVTHDRKTYNGGRFDDLAIAEAAAIALRNELMTNNLLDRQAG